jgi:hypothetical protein
LTAKGSYVNIFIDIYLIGYTTIDGFKQAKKGGKNIKAGSRQRYGDIHIEQ